MSETGERKIARKGVLIALGIICIILITSTAYFVVTIMSAQNSYTDLQNRNIQLQTWLDGNKTMLQQTLANNTNLTDQVNDLNATIKLEKSTVWIDGKYENLWVGHPIYNTPIYSGNATYAGYIVLQVSTDWPNNTAEVTYSFQGLNFNDEINFSGGVTATFRIMPSSDIKVYIWTEAWWILTGPADSYTTITYYY